MYSMCHSFNSTVLLLKSYVLKVTDQDSSVHCLISYKVKRLKSGRNEAYMNSFLFFHKMPLPYTATVKQCDQIIKLNYAKQSNKLC